MKNLKLALPPTVIVYKMEEIKAGNLQMESKRTGSDKGVVYQVGNAVKEVRKGDRIVVPTWVPDSFVNEGETYYFFVSEKFPWIKYVV